MMLPHTHTYTRSLSRSQLPSQNPYKLWKRCLSRPFQTFRGPAIRGIFQTFSCFRLEAFLSLSFRWGGGEGRQGREERSSNISRFGGCFACWRDGLRDLKEFDVGILVALYRAIWLRFRLLLWIRIVRCERPVKRQKHKPCERGAFPLLSLGLRTPSGSVCSPGHHRSHRHLVENR